MLRRDRFNSKRGLKPRRFAGVDAGHVGAAAAIRLQAQVQAVVSGDLGDGRAGRIGEEALLAGSDAVNLRRSRRGERQRCDEGAGGKAVGLCGKDGNMVIARKLTRTVVDPDSHIEKVVDLGFVGEPDKVDVTVLNQILGRELIPVLAPVAAAVNGGTFNVNADTFAGAVAGALKAKRLLLLTDVPGVLDADKNLIEDLSIADARRLIADGTISGGMIPKVETCIFALDQGVEGVVILDGKIPHAVLIEILTDHGAGTLITR